MRPAFACAQGVDLLMDYVEDVLSAESRTTIDTHLQGCPSCVAFVKSYL